MNDFMVPVRRVDTNRMPKPTGDYTGYPNVVRATRFNSDRVLLQLRGEKTYSSAYLSKSQVYDLIEALQSAVVGIAE